MTWHAALVLSIIGLSFVGSMIFFIRYGKSMAEKESLEREANNLDRILKKAKDIRKNHAKIKNSMGSVDWDDIDKLRMSGKKSLVSIADAVVRERGGKVQD